MTKSSESNKDKKKSKVKKKGFLGLFSKNEDSNADQFEFSNSSSSNDESKSRSRSKSLDKSHNIRIETIAKPKFPKMILNQKVVMHIEKGPIVKISKKSHSFHTLEKEISNALKVHYDPAVIKRSEKTKTKPYSKSVDVSDSSSRNTLESDQNSNEIGPINENKQICTIDKIDSSSVVKMNKIEQSSSSDKKSDSISQPNSNEQYENMIKHKSANSNEVSPKLKTLINSKASLQRSGDTTKLCRICKLNGRNMFEPCECKNDDNRLIHYQCLETEMEQNHEYDKCKKCNSNYKTDKFQIIKKRRNFINYFTYDRRHYAALIQLPIYLGFIFLLLALGLIQYEQSYKIVYLKWSAILVFLIIVVILNHIVFFCALIYQLIGKIRRFQNTNFKVTIIPKSESISR